MVTLAGQIPTKQSRNDLISDSHNVLVKIHLSVSLDTDRVSKKFEIIKEKVFTLDCERNIVKGCNLLCLSTGYTLSPITRYLDLGSANIKTGMKSDICNCTDTTTLKLTFDSKCSWCSRGGMENNVLE